MTESILVLRLAGPLQAWGGTSEFSRRDTKREPSKSGVVGLLAAALGRPRSADIDDLVALRMGVRVDQPGTVLRDYHTVSDYRGRRLLNATAGSKGQGHTNDVTKVTERFYLEDAAFVVALGGGAEVMAELAKALRRPAYALFLGRRSCVPTQPLILFPPSVDGDSTSAVNTALWAGSLEEVLARVPWQASDAGRQAWRRNRRLIGEPTDEVRLATAIDARLDADGAASFDLANDVPASFAPLERAFSTRSVVRGWVELPSGFDESAPTLPKHDPMAYLAGDDT